MRKFLKSAIEYLAKDLDLDKELLEQIQYVVIVLTFEFIKCISVILIAGILGYFKESLIVILSMCFIKPFIGGYHEDSQLKCFIATLIITTSIIMLVTFNKLNLFSIVILNLFSIFSIYNKAPVIDSRFPLTKKHLIKKNKILSVTNSSILFLITLIFFKISWISQTITWTLLIQTLLLFNKYKREDS
ncbi:accessory gene regulator AgrB [Clostridium perfringens]|uniref:accessory gene regulator AgrB n=2 Tax=Clostridium perfringens TaxID=1502 RepID=UPI0024BC9D93|nr:accessory gene regulator AgrB [Clostridium perfringens]